MPVVSFFLLMNWNTDELIRVVQYEETIYGSIRIRATLAVGTQSAAYMSSHEPATTIITSHNPHQLKFPKKNCKDTPTQPYYSLHFVTKSIHKFLIPNQPYLLKILSLQYSQLSS